MLLDLYTFSTAGLQAPFGVRSLPPVECQRVCWRSLTKWSPWQLLVSPPSVSLLVDGPLGFSRALGAGPLLTAMWGRFSCSPPWPPHRAVAYTTHCSSPGLLPHLASEAGRGVRGWQAYHSCCFTPDFCQYPSCC